MTARLKRYLGRDLDKEPLKSEQEARAAAAALQVAALGVTAVRTRPGSRRPAAPFITSTLQQVGCAGPFYRCSFLLFVNLRRPWRETSKGMPWSGPDSRFAHPPRGPLSLPLFALFLLLVAPSWSPRCFRLLSLLDGPVSFCIDPLNLPLPPPKDAVRKLGMSAKEVMASAQKLYEGEGGSEGEARCTRPAAPIQEPYPRRCVVSPTGEGTKPLLNPLFCSGLITYMRTDGINMSEEAVAEIREEIKARFGEQYRPESPVS